MPLSKNRRKNGKKILRGKAKRQAERRRELELINERPSGITLQDLINVVAAQEHFGVNEEENQDGR